MLFSSRRFHLGTGAAVLAVVALGAPAVLAACGAEQDGQPTAAERGQDERAFLETMVPHHQSAIEMASIARERAESMEVKRLADRIVADQRAEIAQMRSIHQRLYGRELQPNERAHEALGLTAEQAGMTHGEEGNRRLRSATPFDREFVAMMIPHHQGAVRMAEVVLGSPGDAELRRLAERIIAAQRREIGEMEAIARRSGGVQMPHTGH